MESSSHDDGNLKPQKSFYEDKTLSRLLHQLLLLPIQESPKITSKPTNTSLQTSSSSSTSKPNQNRNKTSKSTKERSEASKQPSSNPKSSSPNSSKPQKFYRRGNIDNKAPTEPDDSNLEDLLKQFVNAASNPSIAMNDHESSLINDFEQDRESFLLESSRKSVNEAQSSFSLLISAIIPRLQHLGPYSKCRHQFAILINALCRRNEKIERLVSQSGVSSSETIHSDSDSSFKLQWSSDLICPVLKLFIQTINAELATPLFGVYLDTLKALSLILFENGNLYSSMYPSLINCLKPLCESRSTLEHEVQRVAFNCLGNMITKTGSHAQPYFEDIWSIISRQMAVIQPQVLIHPSLSRLFASILRAAQFLILEAKTIHENQLPTLISTLNKFIYYGTPLSADSIMSRLNEAASLITRNEEPKSASRDRSDDVEHWISTESENSGSDVYNDKQSVWKVRLHALGCLTSIARCSPSKFTQFWATFLPQSPHQPSIISILLSDPVHQVRSAACRLLSSIFEGQKAYLFASQEMRSSHASSGSPMSFTPLSTKISSILREVHSGLIKALTTETRTTTLVSIIKAIGVIVFQTPYNHLPDGFLVSTLSFLQRLSLDMSLDQRITKAAFGTIAVIVAVPIQSKEIFNFLDPSQFDSSVDYVLRNPPIIRQLEQTLSYDEQALPTSIKIEIFRIFSALASNYLDLFIPTWKLLFRVILDTITGEKAQNNDPNSRLTATKILDEATKSALANLQSPANADKYQSFCREMWLDILNSRVTELMVKDRFALVRTTVCNMFSQVPSIIFTQLPRKHQLMCITLLLGTMRDESAIVRAQAARALGIYILNHSLKVDPLFVSDAGLALIETMKDKNLNVRTKSAWALANLCDSLVIVREVSPSGEHHSENPVDDLIITSIPTDDIPREVLLSIARAVLLGCKDNDKVRCNAVRALGNFTRFASTGLFSEDDGSIGLLKSIIEALIHNTKEGSAKVRWNACYALANIFHNKFIISLSKDAIDSSIDALLNLLETATNFKIRINSAMALNVAVTSVAFSPEVLQKMTQITINSMTRDLSDENYDLTASRGGSDYRETLREQLSKLLVSILAMVDNAASISADFKQLICSNLKLINSAIASCMGEISEPKAIETGEHQLKPNSATESKYLPNSYLRASEDLKDDDVESKLSAHSAIRSISLQELSLRASKATQLIQSFLPVD